MKDRAMQEPTFLILTALAAAQQHGYAMIAEIERISEGQVRLRPGTLYAALERLTNEGLVSSAHDEVVDGRLRRYYALTATGAERLAEEAQRLRRHADAAASRLSLGPSASAEPA